MRIAFFATCIVDAMFPRAAAATVTVLERLGHDVAVAPSGSCVASVKHQHPVIARWAGDQDLQDRAVAVGKKTYELSGLPPIWTPSTPSSQPAP